MFIEVNTSKPRIHDYLHYSDIKKNYLFKKVNKAGGGAGVSEARLGRKSSKMH